MKVINEVTNGTISGWKNRYEAAELPQDKLKIFKSAFIEDDVLPPGSNSEEIIDKIISFGFDFVDKWVNAMRWDEIGNKNNSFIKLLSQPNISSSSEMLKNINNFLCIYNVYASGLFDIDYYLEESEAGDVYRKIIDEERSYSYGQEDFKELFKIFNDIKDNDNVPDNIKNDGIKFVFLEDEDGNIHGDLNSYSMILEKLKEYNNKLKNSNLSSGKYLNDTKNAKKSVGNIKNMNIENMTEDDAKNIINQSNEDQLKWFINAIDSKINNT